MFSILFSYYPMNLNQLQSLSSQYLTMSWEDLTNDQYHELIKILINHNALYYNNHEPIISDIEYDNLFALCKLVEFIHQDWIAIDSPTQWLVWQVDSSKSNFDKVRHRNPLLSLENTYDADELSDWYDGVKRITDKLWINDIWPFTIEPKYDGISIELIYKDWNFVQGITRGDGQVGEDITKNISFVSGIPATIDTKSELHLRWEIVMPKSHFESINQERSQNWLPLFSNPRNATSGIVKQLQTPVEMQKRLVCYVYDVI